MTHYICNLVYIAILEIVFSIPFTSGPGDLFSLHTHVGIPGSYHKLSFRSIKPLEACLDCCILMIEVPGRERTKQRGMDCLLQVESKV